MTIGRPFRPRILWMLLPAMIVLGEGVAARAQPPSPYESEPVLLAKDLAGPELLKGPHFTVDPDVPIKGFIARFTIRSAFGEFDAHGLRMLSVRVNEVEAIAKLEELKQTGEFSAAAGRAAMRPVTSAASMLARPVETISGIPDGVGRLFGRLRLAGQQIAQSATAPGQTPLERAAAVSRRVGTAAINALGFEHERRQLAQRLGVDPYTTNPVLSEKLTDVAWVSFSGRLGVVAAMAILVPYSEVMSAVTVTNRTVWDTPPADLLISARAAFGGTGASADSVQALMENPQYSLSLLTALATGIERLGGLPGRDTVVAFAAAAQTQDEVYFVVGAVNMLARHHETVVPLARVSAPGPIVGHTAADALVLPAPVDYVSWIEALGQMMGRPELQAPERVAVLSGRMSPLAQKNGTAHGWRIHEANGLAAER